MSGIVGQWCRLCQTSSHDERDCPSLSAGSLAVQYLRDRPPSAPKAEQAVEHLKAVVGLFDEEFIDAAYQDKILTAARAFLRGAE